MKAWRERQLPTFDAAGNEGFREWYELDAAEKADLGAG
jgi:hypothetical protein